MVYFEFIAGDESIFTYDIYLIIYPTTCFPVSKIYGILGSLLMSIEVMLILVYENVCGDYATVDTKF